MVIWKYVAHACRKISFFQRRQKIQFVTALDQIKCPDQIKYQGLILRCAPISNICTIT